ncbi:hypothetical protein ABT264_34245 [Streptomyces virginiae]|uniref:hypothetical protein n=1 Tax=Streptomyces virginiae TaxID=1961 RepID=UPI00332BF406
MAARKWWMAMALAVMVTPVLGGAAAQAEDAVPVLEKLAPAGTITVKDDKSCFDLQVTGNGFEPNEQIQLNVGTDRAMGVLKGAPVTVTTDTNGEITPLWLHPCQITTHGAIERDFTCTANDVERGDCQEHQIGDVITSGSRWRSTQVWVQASREVPAEPHPDDGSPYLGNEPYWKPVTHVTWPLEITSLK